MSGPRVLVIAGTDSSGGAGLVRDVRTLARMNVPVACAVTAVTAQTDSSVSSVYPLPPAEVRAQMSAALGSGDIGAIKIGMLGTQAIVEIVAEVLTDHRGPPIVLDPVLYSSSGSSLLDPAGIVALRRLIFPLAALLTPNLPEAAYLAQGGHFTPGVASARTTVEGWAHALLAQGPQAVLLKGGHATGAAVADVLVRPGCEALWFSDRRLEGQARGTGCALAAAVAGALARGEDLEQACRCGRAHVRALFREKPASVDTPASDTS